LEDVGQVQNGIHILSLPSSPRGLMGWGGNSWQEVWY